MNVEDEIVSTAIRVGDFQQLGASTGFPYCCRICEMGAGKKDRVLRSSFADCRNGTLHAICPGSDIQIVRFVHETECDAGVRAVLCCKLTPQAVELVVCGSTLTDDAAIPPCIVVDINDAH